MLCITSSTHLKDEMINFNQIQLATHKCDIQPALSQALSTKDTKESTRVSHQEAHKEWPEPSLSSQMHWTILAAG